MVDLEDVWARRGELVLASIIICLLVVWVQEAFQNPLLFPIRLAAGLYVSTFPVGFLMLSMLFPSRQEMLWQEWFAYSVAMSIVTISLGSFAFNFFFGIDNSIWVNMRIILVFAVLFYLIGKAKEIFL